MRNVSQRIVRRASKRRSAATLSLLLLSTALASAPLRADDIDRYVEARIAEVHVPGLSLAVVRDGKVVKEQGYGFADLEQRVPATPSTVYELGSVTKQFTAALVMMLVEERKLRLDDPLSRWFPDGPAFWHEITLAHLLSHRGGIQNHVAVPGYLGIFTSNEFFTGAPTQEDLLRKFYALPREFPAGATWSYDNTGYILLGWILERASGRTYWQLLDDRIFAPLGMTASRSTDPRPLVPGRARGYGFENHQFENRAVLWPHVAYSAGAVLSTVEDMARWEIALEGHGPLSAASRTRMWTAATAPDGSPLPFDYGFGWFLSSVAGHRVVQHSGGTGGFSSVFYRFPDDRLAVILLTNHSDMILDEMAIDIAGLVEPSLRLPESAADPDPALTARLRTVFAGLMAGRHEAKDFTPPMELFLGTATGKAFFQWFTEHGELGSVTFAAAERRGEDRLLRYAVVLGRTRYWLLFRVTPSGKIAQITF